MKVLIIWKSDSGVCYPSNDSPLPSEETKCLESREIRIHLHWTVVSEPEEKRFLHFAWYKKYT